MLKQTLGFLNIIRIKKNNHDARWFWDTLYARGRKKERNGASERETERREAAKVQPKRKRGRESWASRGSLFRTRCRAARQLAAGRPSARLWTDRRSFLAVFRAHSSVSFLSSLTLSFAPAGVSRAPSCTPIRVGSATRYGRVSSSALVTAVAAVAAAAGGHAIRDANLVSLVWRVLGAWSRSPDRAAVTDGRAPRCNGWRESVGRFTVGARCADAHFPFTRVTIASNLFLLFCRVPVLFLSSFPPSFFPSSMRRVWGRINTLKGNSHLDGKAENRKAAANQNSRW